MDALDQKKKKKLIMETKSCSGKLLKAGSEVTWTGEVVVEMEV